MPRMRNSPRARPRSSSTQPAVAAIDVRGGGPGTREDALLDLASTVERVDAIALSGGSAFGIDAGGGVQAWLAEQGRGFADSRGGDPDRAGRDRVRPAQRRRQGLGPLRALSRSRLRRSAVAAGDDFALGSVGAGLGATTATFKGGLGSASAVLANGIKVAAIMVVNAVGSATVGEGPWFWAAPFEENGEFGGRGLPPRSRRTCWRCASRAVPPQARARTPRSASSSPMRR